MTAPAASEAAGEPTEIEALVAEALERTAAGQPVDVGALVGHRPELRADVEAALRAARRLSGLSLATGARDAVRGSRVADRYLLGARIEVNVHGVVHEAVDERSGEAVAVELVREDLVAEETVRQALLATLADVRRIEHPGVMPLRDHGRLVRGQVYFVRALPEGRGLDELLQELHELDDVDGAIDAARVGLRPANTVLVGWLADVAGGLAAAHAAGVVHGALEARHVWVAVEGSAALEGFGVAPLVRRREAQEREGWPGALAAPERPGQGTPRGDVLDLVALLLHALAPPRSETHARGVIARMVRRFKRGTRLPRELHALVRRVSAPSSTLGAADVEAALRAWCARADAPRASRR